MPKTLSSTIHNSPKDDVILIEDEPPPARPSGHGAPEATETAALTAQAAPQEHFIPIPGTATLVGSFAAAVVFAALFSSLGSSLLRALPADVLEAQGDGELSSTGRSSGQTETLAASATLLAFIARAAATVIAFLTVVKLAGLPGDQGANTPLPWPLAVALVAGICGPLLHLATMSMPVAIADAHGDKVIKRLLPMCAMVIVPGTWIVKSLSAVRRMLLRVIDTPDADYNTRRLVEGFRAVVQGTEMRGELGADTRELIVNVIEFGEADAAEVMTPRTEIDAIEASSTLEQAIAVFAESGFSRIPVYVETVDTIIGTLTALEAAKAVAEDRLKTTSIRSVMRPPMLVPETQLVPELLATFRSERQKMAIVVDEYGGTAGLVTLADVMAEILGHVQDEFEDEEAPAFQRLDDGRVEIDASQHVADVNEEAFLTIPEEEDYETLAGFVLSEIGRFPSQGESIECEGVRYEVSEATDRRIVRVILSSDRGIQLAAEIQAALEEEKNDRAEGARRGGVPEESERPLAS